MEAYVVSERLGGRLRAGTLDFRFVEKLVGESEESTLYRLKEECHALFRFGGADTPTEVQAEELFDLAVGALFHEAMKFRESFYVTTIYGPRLERALASGTPPGPLVAAFRRAFEAGRRRMLEAQSETRDLFRETRAQLVALLRELPPSGAVARSLVEDPDRATEVFGSDLDPLLGELYGSPDEGVRLALANLVESGHYARAADLLARGSGAANGLVGVLPFARGMERYYAGDLPAALDALESWIEAGAPGEAEWRARAKRALTAAAAGCVPAAASAQARAAALVERLRPARPS
jgi:hypothetical protein